mmetsp:Transcript_7091/g.9111  ORF Transcript_7091/g.9111 Transcript_7091/m.9111 type:complete len:208 (-) Transcript_7091:1062-1685(-)
MYNVFRTSVASSWPWAPRSCINGGFPKTSKPSAILPSTTVPEPTVTLSSSLAPGIITDRSRIMTFLPMFMLSNVAIPLMSTIKLRITAPLAWKMPSLAVNKSGSMCIGAKESNTDTPPPKRRVIIRLKTLCSGRSALLYSNICFASQRLAKSMEWIWHFDECKCPLSKIRRAIKTNGHIMKLATTAINGPQAINITELTPRFSPVAR